jgi:hypothetical protein
LKTESKPITSRVALILIVLVILIAAITLLAPGYKPKPTGTIALSCLGYTTPSNPKKTIFITISNANPETIVYFVCDPESKSNGSWPRFQFPTGVSMDRLSPGQSLMHEIKAPFAGGEVRVPVIWGTLSPSKGQQLRNKVEAFFRAHKLFGRGTVYSSRAVAYTPHTNGLYTDYLEGIDLDKP